MEDEADGRNQGVAEVKKARTCHHSIPEISAFSVRDGQIDQHAHFYVPSLYCKCECPFIYLIGGVGCLNLSSQICAGFEASGGFDNDMFYYSTNDIYMSDKSV
jgi:hypothetical protein